MSHDNTKGVIRSNSTLSPKAIEKRVRRKVAHVNAFLTINRPGTPHYAKHGECSVISYATGDALFNGSLVKVAKHIGAISDIEADSAEDAVYEVSTPSGVSYIRDLAEASAVAGKDGSIRRLIWAEVAHGA